MTTTEPDRLFTPAFFTMCGYTFTVFVSLFVLLPTVPFRILALGGDEFTAGLFLAFLTYCSALSAPLTGALADRLGKRRVLLVCSIAIAGFTTAYGLSHGYAIMLAFVAVHGFFWSALLSASSAYLTDHLPPQRRAEGIAWWGLSTILAIAIAPGLGFWLYEQSWQTLCGTSAALNVAMALIATRLKETRRQVSPPRRKRDLIEWRVLALSGTLFLYAFGYGGITSFVALYADENGVSPRSLYFSVFAGIVLLTRPFSGRLADRIGYLRVFLASVAVMALGQALLAWSGTREFLVASALLFGLGLGTAYPAYAAWVIKQVGAERRGAAFGSILAGFDTGIGTGSMTLGLLIQRFGFQVAFGTAASLAAVSIPYFLWCRKKVFPDDAPPA